jgi:hypothetical protein
VLILPELKRKNISTNKKIKECDRLIPTVLSNNRK